MTRVMLTEDARRDRRTAAIYGILAGVTLGFIVSAVTPMLIRYFLHIPTPVPMSALETCEKRLERFAYVAGVADEIDRVEANKQEEKR